MIKDSIIKVRERIIFVCSKVKRDPDEICIVAVSKNRPVEQIKEAIEAGLDNIGENRVQEAVVKYNELSAPAIKWHLLGHLQTNKAKEAVKIFDLIHSVDSLHLAEIIDKEAAKINKIQDILLEVKVSPELTKFGLSPEDVPEVIKEISEFKNIRIKGLMAIAPIVGNPEQARPYFRRLRELFNKINELSAIDRPEGRGLASDSQSHYQLSALSMGMTDDFEVAVEEGSNMVRLGRAIFE